MILISVLIVLAFLFVFYSSKEKQGWELSQEARKKKKEENKNKILKELQNKDKISNDEVQKLLGVSDATATRYLEELEKEGKIHQIGGTQKDTFYQMK